MVLAPKGSLAEGGQEVKKRESIDWPMWHHAFMRFVNLGPGNDYGVSPSNTAKDLYGNAQAPLLDFADSRLPQ